MNGKKARMLRSLAATKSEKDMPRAYTHIPHTVKQKNATVPVVGLDGTTTERVIGSVTTATYTLAAGARKLYQNLKKNYMSVTHA